MLGSMATPKLTSKHGATSACTSINCFYNMFGNESERCSARDPSESRGGVFLTDQGRFAAPGRIACSGLVDPCLALDRDGKSAQAMRQRDPIPNEKALKGRLRNGGICWDCGRMHCRKCFEIKVEDGIRCQGSKKTTSYKFVWGQASLNF